MNFSKPLAHITVIELAGLAPGPLCGQIFSDYGARVIRIDRTSGINNDTLTRGKLSVSLNLQSTEGRQIFTNLLSDDRINVLLDTYRPGVLERMADWTHIEQKRKTRLIVARLTGFGQTSKHAGHDINYLAESGILSAIGPPGQPPVPPNNTLGDFAGLALPAYSAVLTVMAEPFDPSKQRKVRFIDVNIVESLRYMAQFVSHAKYSRPENSSGIVDWSQPRGLNTLEGVACPFYTIYETKDHRYVSVGAIEPQFYKALITLLELDSEKLPDRYQVSNWPALKAKFATVFAQKNYVEWTKLCAGATEACAVPVKDLATLAEIPDALVTNLGEEGNKALPVRTSRSELGGWQLEVGKDTEQILKEFFGSSKL